VLWTCHFLAAQGEYVPTTTIYQDNKSTILLAENGKSSSSKWTRHLNVRYYFVTDQIKKGHVKVAFWPTQEMIADFFTKPLQGLLFMRMHEKILNLPASKIASVHRSVLEDQKKNTDLISTRLISTSRKDMKRDNAGENKNDKKKQDWDTRLGT